eukprot:TRINITY_DN30638_c0_g1_i1.p1 TRINITY_DN30638_c0_g1~~TRINITY_DN30638_c0_g1_i1.p1  ORF type:complete len:261 (+),score=39.53 TRINITY_DN30638_c0_g1_i1:382-1164(+)
MRRPSWHATRLSAFLLILLPLLLSYGRVNCEDARDVSEEEEESDQDAESGSRWKPSTSPSPPGGERCNATGACVPCSSEDKQTISACWSTGYRQAFTCVEPIAALSSEDTSSLLGRTKKRSRNGAGSGSKGAGAKGSRDALQNRRGRRLLSSALFSSWFGRSPGSGGLEDGDVVVVHSDDGSSSSQPRMRLASTAATSVRRYDTFRSCTPEKGEALSVFRFEVLVLALLGVCGPLMYQRKRRANAGAPPGVSRIPSNARF